MGVKEGEGGGEAHKGALEEAPPHVGSWASGSAGCGCLGQRGRGDTEMERWSRGGSPGRGRACGRGSLIRESVVQASHHDH